MNRNYQKIIFCFIVATILLIWNSSYAFIYLCGFTLVMIYLVYDINKQNLQQIDFYRQKKENEIREVEGEKDFNHKILNSLIKTMNLPMIFINCKGTIIFTNQSFRDAFNIKHLRGKYYKDIFVGQLLNVVDQSYVFERKFSTVTEINERYYQIESTPVFRNESFFDGSIILFTDVSQVKEIEKMQKQFFSDISHELKTPMSAIIGSVEILQKEGIQNKETFDEFMGILLKESYRMQNIIEDILELSRLEQPRVTLSPKLIDVDSIVKDTVELFEPLAKDKHLSMVYQTKVSKELMLDYATVKTILNNLVSNAIKYSNSGVISIKAFNDKDKLTLIVQDEGIGISKDDIPLIYDRFFQVDRSRSKKLGTGLGLSIVKRMVELNNGSISVESDQGIGSVFTVVLPILCE
ncbi:sensor histidine kinase [Thomasclavelia spiroformis]|jgi:two-component system phosphate regulon sensor histidine kinase PhoR|uniref:sensor histidine kinase n=1 Tax=Thomasclavelia spiroformis TaxID=29348 RepID=UPI000B387DA0|nr:HAMP domain-containing sensor histidine kinase [Thomasclavelia spiroformis]OUO70147.1 two-component sensor histidine kinase [Thomasclavelia spiroformis]